MILTAAAMTIPKGLNIATKTGHALCRHHVETPTCNAEPKTRCVTTQEKVASHSFQGKEKCREHLERLSGNEIKASEIKHADIVDYYASIHITSAENFFTTY